MQDASSGDEPLSAGRELGDAVQMHRVTGFDEVPSWTDVEEIARFLHEQMQPYHDTLADVHRGLKYALGDEPGTGGFMILASLRSRLVGAVVFLETGMKGYIPENLLLFACVAPELRGLGIGRKLIERALAHCGGPVKLHVERDNPARRLYERVGFTNKYIEMRYFPS
jgi:GNAT superfamily N-acetyltransferase